MDKRYIRNLGKRFEITLFQLSKIIEDWGQCRGLSGNDVTELERIHSRLNKLYEKGKPFEEYKGAINENEFV